MTVAPFSTTEPTATLESSHVREEPSNFKFQCIATYEDLLLRPKLYEVLYIMEVETAIHVPFFDQFRIAISPECL